MPHPPRAIFNHLALPEGKYWRWCLIRLGIRGKCLGQYFKKAGCLPAFCSPIRKKQIFFQRTTEKGCIASLELLTADSIIFSARSPCCIRQICHLIYFLKIKASFSRGSEAISIFGHIKHAADACCQH